MASSASNSLVAGKADGDVQRTQNDGLYPKIKGRRAVALGSLEVQGGTGTQETAVLEQRSAKAKFAAL